LGLLLALLLVASATAERPNERSPLGINLFKVRPYARELAFADLLAARGRWVTGGSGAAAGESVALDPDGWPRALAPGQWVETPILPGFGPHLPKGGLTARYEGNGDVEFVGARVAQAQPGRVVLDLLPDAPRHALRIRSTDPQNPVRNVRLWIPGATGGSASGPWNPAFLSRWEKFSVLRFMDWMETNGSRIERWSDRPLPDQPQGTERGVALEHMVDLANRLRADPWFCMPHRADDDYVREFARLVKARLAPGLRAWIEYSNEVWNGQFEQARYARRRGLELGLSAKEYEAGFRFTSQRAVEVFSIWERELGGTDRIVRVLAGQISGLRGGRELLGWKDASQRADAYAVAAYFGGRLARREGERLVTLGLDGLLRELRAELAAQREMIRQNVELGRSLGLPLLAYEGGQHLRGSPRVPGLSDLLIAASRSPSMGELYTVLLRQWKEAGGTLFVHFSSTSRAGDTGSWGALEWWDEPTSPKYRALVEFIDASPRWWPSGAP
jgi:hypothetical protein